MSEIRIQTLLVRMNRDPSESNLVPLFGTVKRAGKKLLISIRTPNPMFDDKLITLEISKSQPDEWYPLSPEHFKTGQEFCLKTPPKGDIFLLLDSSKRTQTTWWALAELCALKAHYSVID